MPEPTIHDACQRGDVETVRAWIAADPSVVDADDAHGWRPLFHAGLWRREEVVRLLIAAGADLAAHEGYALHYAGEVPGNKAIVALLLQHGVLEAHARPADDLSRQFLAAVFLADEARGRSLLGRHPHLATVPDGCGDRPIHHAARNGDAAIVGLLLEHGADLNARGARGHTVLYCAGGHGHLEALTLLLNAGASDDDVESLRQWLAPYPDDTRFAPIAEALRQHQARAGGDRDTNEQNSDL